jgi:hypothetical protein
MGLPNLKADKYFHQLVSDNILTVSKDGTV